LVRRVGTALVDQLEEEVQAQLSQQLERPELRERRAAVHHVQQTLRLEVPQLPNSAKDALEPLLRRTLELADSESFLSQLIQTLETHEFTALERLVLLNRLAPESLIEIQLFDEPQETPAPGLRLVSDPDDESSGS